MSTLEMTEEKRQLLKNSLKTFHYKPTRFEFLNEHFGLRKKCLHVLMGTSGQGKTTIARSVMADIARHHKIFCYGTEETLEQTQAMFSLRETGNEILKNFFFCHELDIKNECGSNVDEWLRLLEMKIMNEKCEVLFFDNITTSSFYDGLKMDQTNKVVDGVMKILKVCNIAGFFIAHTANGVKDDQQALFSTSDIRGNKSITNRAEFVYAYQKFIGEASPTGQTTPSHGTIRNLKARNYDVGSTFLLGYDFNKREYLGDARIPNTKFKEIYDARFKLGK